MGKFSLWRTNDEKYAFINFFRLEVLFGSTFVFFISFFSLQSDALIFSPKLTFTYAFLLLFIFFATFVFKRRNALKKLRRFSFFIYFLGLLYAIYVAYINQYSLFSYAVLMITYIFYLITLYNFKIFIRLNALISFILITTLLLLDFKTIVNVYLILFSLVLLFCLGAILTYSRQFRTNRVKKREKLLDHIFDNSRQGLILVNAEEHTINEINSKALNILGLRKENVLEGKKINQIKLWGKQIFKDIFEQYYSTINGNEGQLLTIKRTDFNFDQSDRYIIEINLFYDETQDYLPSELDRIKMISEENFENLFKNSASFICIIDRQGTIIDINRSIMNRLEYKRSDIIGKKYNHFDAKDYEKEREIFNQKAWAGNDQIFEKTVLNKNKEKIYLEVILKKGKYLGKEVLISNSRDISKRKELEKKVQERTRVYKNLIQNSSIAIAFTDLKGNFIEFNKAFSTYLEYEESELLNMNLSQLILKSDWNSELEDFSQLLEGKRKTIESEQRFLTKNNQIKYALLKFLLQSSDKESRPMILHQVVDITGMVEAKNKLKKSEESYRNLFNYSNELLYMLDKENRFIDVNQTVIDKYGYKKKEIIGKSPDFLAAPGKNDMDKVKKLTNDMWDGKEVRMLWWSKTKEGKYFPKDLIGRKGTYFGREVAIVSGRDISKQFEYENRLKESSKKYKDLIDSSSWGVIIFKGEKIVFANKKAAEILKYPHDELSGKKRTNFIKNEKEREAYRKRLKQLNQGKDLPLREYEVEGKKGEKTTIELKAKQINYEGEECVLLSFIDIKDRKEIEKAKQKMYEAKSANKNLKMQLEQNRQIQIRLQNEQSYSHGVIESSLDMIFTTNVSGRLTKLNTAAKKKLGIQNSTYLNKHFSILFIHASTGEKINRELNQKGSFSGEVTMKKLNQESFTAFISCSYLFNAENEFLGIMGISRDISDIKKKEREIKEQASKLNTIIESSSHYFFTIDREYKFTSFNKRLKEDAKKNYGIDLNKRDSFFVLYENASTSSKNEQIYFWNKHFTNCFNGHFVEFETENIGPDGKHFYREIYLNPIYNENGEIEELSGIGHDTTDKRLYEKELKKSLKEKEVLLQEVHHRVKNNMQVISSILNLQSANVTDKKLLSILNESQGRIRAMAAIHERLYRTKNFSDVKFSSYIKNLSESLVYSYEYGETAIDLICEVDEIFLTLDYSIPCGLIVNELISNALKYAFKGREKGEIKIILKKQNDTISIRVEDNGVGFKQKQNIESTDSLGLQLVNTLVEQIEGKMIMEQSSGTKYVITFRA